MRNNQFSHIASIEAGRGAAQLGSIHNDIAAIRADLLIGTLTKRQQYALAAMQAILSRAYVQPPVPAVVATAALSYADAMIAAGG